MRAISLGFLAVGLIGLTACGTMQGMNPFAKAPPPPSAYVVFFPGHTTGLSDDARHIVAAAAEVAKANPAMVVEVSGPSRRVAAGYDPRFAQPRIDAVDAELMADGVPQARIAQGSSLTDNLETDATGAQRVELRVIKAQ